MVTLFILASYFNLRAHTVPETPEVFEGQRLDNMGAPPSLITVSFCHVYATKDARNSHVVAGKEVPCHRYSGKCLFLCFAKTPAHSANKLLFFKGACGYRDTDNWGLLD